MQADTRKIRIECVAAADPLLDPDDPISYHREIPASFFYLDLGKRSRYAPTSEIARTVALHRSFVGSQSARMYWLNMARGHSLAALAIEVIAASAAPLFESRKPLLAELKAAGVAPDLVRHAGKQFDAAMLPGLEDVYAKATAPVDQTESTLERSLFSGEQGANKAGASLVEVDRSHQSAHASRRRAQAKKGGMIARQSVPEIPAPGVRDIPTPGRGDLLDPRLTRSLWATWNQTLMLLGKEGRIISADAIAERAASCYSHLVRWTDGLADQLYELSGETLDIEATVAACDAFRRKLNKQVAKAVEDFGRARGHDAELEFVVDGEVINFADWPEALEMHQESPALTPDGLRRAYEWARARVFAPPHDEVIATARRIIEPPDRMPVDQLAAKHIKVAVPGGTFRPYDPEETPYMIEPMRETASRDAVSVVFVGPAQSGKTAALIDAKIVECVLGNPADMMIVQTTQGAASDYADRRLARMIETTPALAERCLPTMASLRKTFDAGQIISVTWPTRNTLAGKSIPVMLLTDYDRMPLDIGGEGSAFKLAQARTRTFQSRGMTVAESSPAHDVDPDSDPPPEGSHLAPQALGIAALYNQGSRARLYTQCLHCGDAMPFWNSCLHWQEIVGSDGIIDATASSKTARLVCPSCGGIHEFTDRPELYRRCRDGWRHERSQSPERTYWLDGVAARWSTWQTLVYRRLIAEQQLADTNDVTPLRTTLNIDWCENYRPESRKSSIEEAAELRQRATRMDQRKVPEAAGVITTAVDVQKRRFVVQVEARGRGGEAWVIDRFNITKSQRINEAGSQEPISPGTYAEDWAILDELLDREYENDAGVIFKPNALAIDTGGIDNTTRNAYAWWRANDRRDRIFLTKGYTPKSTQAKREQQRIERTKGDADARGKRAVPLYILQTNRLKDEVIAAVDRIDPGPGKLHIPSWVGDWWLAELLAEERTAHGWKKIRERSNNEALDLCCMNRAAWTLLGGDDGRLESYMPQQGESPADMVHRANTMAKSTADALRERMAALARGLNRRTA